MSSQPLPNPPIHGAAHHHNGVVDHQAAQHYAKGTVSSTKHATAAVQQANGAREVLDMQSFMRNLAAGNAAGGEAGAGGGGAAAAAPQSAAEIEREKKFQRFLAKEKKRAVERDAARMAYIRANRPTFQPELPTKGRHRESNVIRKATFMQRLEDDRLHRRRDYGKLKRDAECTFNPKISKRGKQARARKWREMSLGDAARRDRKLHELRAQADVKRMEGVTFRPQLEEGRGMGRIRSTLQLSSHPDSYLDRLQHKAQMLEEKQYAALVAADEKEIEECTFAPKISDAPGYIKRIAQGVRLAKDAKRAAEPEEPEKQGWR